ncbi:MAG: hypothetical protein IAG10_28455 [Planctomycetaceae bacterium]|nr:hypothetical protein [Planctomycetaceae bacterium]
MAREDEIVELLKEIRDSQKAMCDLQREHSQKALDLYQQRTTQKQNLAKSAETEISKLPNKIFWTIIAGVVAYFLLTSAGGWITKFFHKLAG